jgi:HlyD family secretion protein
MSKRVIISGILLLLFMGALVLAQPRGGATAVSAAPSSQTTTRAVSAEGQVVPLFFVDLAFQTGGLVAERLVAEGDLVQTGDPLIRLDSAEVELALSQAEARLASAETGVTLAQNQLALAEAAVRTAEAQLESAQANLALTRAGARAEEVTAAESRLAAAQATVNQAIGQRDTALNVGTTAQIRGAEAQVAAAAAEVRGLEEQYDTIITTCFDTPAGEVCPLLGTAEETTRARLEAARQNLAAAQAGLDALRAGPTAAQRQAAQGGVELATANRDLAQAQLDLLLSGATPEQIAIAEVGVRRAEVGVALAETAVQEAAAAIIQAEAAVAQAQAGVAATELALERMTLRATFSGTVSQINVNVGELVGQGVPALTLADFSTWQVKTTDLTELDVAFVDAGDPVRLQFDAIPGETVTGRVTQVALVAGQARGDVVYEVTISLDAAPTLPLRWGMTAVVEIES